jgi:hypothetical protein
VDGDGGSDTLATGAGDDVVDGGLGFDTCRPGSGVNAIRRCERVTSTSGGAAGPPAAPPARRADARLRAVAPHSPSAGSGARVRR